MQYCLVRGGAWPVQSIGSQRVGHNQSHLACMHAYSPFRFPHFRNHQHTWKYWYIYVRGLFALKFWVPSVLRFERRWLTFLIKSRQCLCRRLKRSTKVSDHSTLMYSAIILQMERCAGIQRHVSPNQAAMPVAEICSYTHKWAYTYTLTYRRGVQFYQHVPTFLLVSSPATWNWYGFYETKCFLVSTKGVYSLRCLPGKKKKKTKKKKDGSIFIRCACIWFVKPREMLIEAMVERWVTQPGLITSKWYQEQCSLRIAVGKKN